jgi:hypothetical protein
MVTSGRTDGRENRYKSKIFSVIQKKFEFLKQGCKITARLVLYKKNLTGANFN